MRDKAKRHNGSTYSLDKVFAAIYVAIFVAVVGIGVHKQLTRIMPGEPEMTSLASTEATTP